MTAASGEPRRAPAPSALHRATRRAAYAIGAAGLAIATLSDAIAVTGRHLGLHLLGSIELTQSGIVLLGSGAMLYATLESHHASVHMLTSRLSPPHRAKLARLMAVISALVMLTIAAGTAWVTADLWNGFEQTELLHLPVRWLRVLWLVVALGIALLFARSALCAPSQASPGGAMDEGELL